MQTARWRKAQGQVKPEGKEASHKPEKTRAKVRGRIDQRQRSGDQREQQRGDDLDVGRNRRHSQAHWKHDMEPTLQKYRTARHEVSGLAAKSHE